MEAIDHGPVETGQCLHEACGFGEEIGPPLHPSHHRTNHRTGVQVGRCSARLGLDDDQFVRTVDREIVARAVVLQLNAKAALDAVGADEN